MARLLVIGSGGREHAIIWKLTQSEEVEEIYVSPGSYAIQETSSKVKNAEIDIKKFEDVAKFCQNNNVEMVIVGPEDPLANGIADYLIKESIDVFGPQKEAATIESDKKWAKNFMDKHGIPTAKWKSFTDSNQAQDFIKKADFPALVVKASGLAAGKGVVVATNQEEACKAVTEILTDHKYGNAGDVVVVEELLQGEECSLLAFCDGNTFKIMLPAQDHKRIYDNDKGPNTGGMGVVCPSTVIDDYLEEIKETVFKKAMEGFKKEGILYVGVLYAGLMRTPQGPKVLEFNCRFGDPETEVILPLLESDLYKIMKSCCKGTLNNVEVKFQTNVSAVGVVMASKGYPETSSKGQIITGVDKVAAKENHIVFHCGTAFKDNNLLTNGGRVLINVVIADSAKNASIQATKACEEDIQFDGKQFRKDIGHKEVARQILQSGELTYKASGVDITAGNDLVSIIKPAAKSTDRKGVMGGLGGFGGLFDLKAAGFKDPLLIAKTNIVGTKLKIAEETGNHEIIGADLVAMCVNDILSFGAEPLFFLDYYACGNLDINIAKSVIKGMAEACKSANCSLIGGETAEMPGFYEKGIYDIHGFAVGAVERTEKYKFNFENGDILIALPSEAINISGFNEIDRIMKENNLKYSDKAPFSEGKTFGDEFLTPSKIYTKSLFTLNKNKINVKAFIPTTSGLTNSIFKTIPDGFKIELDGSKWEMPKIISWLIANEKTNNQFSTFKHFNVGIGAVIIVSKEDCDKAIQLLSNENPINIGCISNQNSKAESEIYINNTQDLYKNEAVLKINRDDVNVDMNEFGIVFDMNKAGFKDALLVSGTDGVGTKLKLAQTMNVHNTIGIDLVAMCVNDLLAHGAQPLILSPGFACGKLDKNTIEEVNKGIKNGCNETNCQMINGTTAVLPDLYPPGKYDISAFAVGAVERQQLMPNYQDIQENDVVIGLSSSGFHSNGYSLVNKVLNILKLDYKDVQTKFLYHSLLTPTNLYVKSVRKAILSGKIKAFAHITGGGLLENVPRVLPKHLGVKLNALNWNIPECFSFIAANGNVNAHELLRTFNCGIGGIILTKKENVQDVLNILKQEGMECSLIGHVIKYNNEGEQVLVENFKEKMIPQMLPYINLTDGMFKQKKRVAVLISGSGTNLQALINSSFDKSFEMGAEIVLVISNKSGVQGLERAKNANIPTLVLKHVDYKSREEFDEAMHEKLLEANVDIICLAGFMRILSAQFTAKWKGKLINIHPALLPKFKGLHAQKQALEAGEKISGCTVHFVNEDVDAGAIITQEEVPILPGDTEDDLTERIKLAEHKAYPRALKWLATEKVKLNDQNKAIFQDI